jgi:hypothetical protein
VRDAVQPRLLLVVRGDHEPADQIKRGVDLTVVDARQQVLKYPAKPCVIIMDEIFNSTNVVEAIAGAYSILEN